MNEKEQIEIQKTDIAKTFKNESPQIIVVENKDTLEHFVPTSGEIEAMSKQDNKESKDETSQDEKPAERDLTAQEQKAREERQKVIENKEFSRANVGNIYAAQVIDQLQYMQKTDTYVVHGATMICSFGSREARLVVPLSHGEFINNRAQMHQSDCVPEVNIKCFGNCTSPNNPNVKKSAEEALDKFNNRKKTLWEKVISIFSKPEKTKISDEFLSQTIGACEPCFAGDMKWLKCREENLIEDEPTLLCTSGITCMYGGLITILKDGQIEE